MAYITTGADEAIELKRRQLELAEKQQGRDVIKTIAAVAVPLATLFAAYWYITSGKKKSKRQRGAK